MVELELHAFHYDLLHGGFLWVMFLVSRDNSSVFAEMMFRVNIGIGSSDGQAGLRARGERWFSLRGSGGDRSTYIEYLLEYMR